VADHVPALASAHVRVRSIEGAVPSTSHAGHHHAPDPVPVKGTFVEAVLEIVDTPNGERMRLTAARLTGAALSASVVGFARSVLHDGICYVRRP